MIRLIFLVCLASTIISQLTPNFIHIVVDDWGYNDIGFRDPFLATPVMDELAGKGVVLENFYMTPVCTPSRGALNTGRMPWKWGMQDFKPDVDNPQGVPKTEQFLSERLYAAGYRTAAVGKWDLGVSSTDQLPLYRGYGDAEFQLPDVPSQTWGGGCNQVNFAITNKDLVDTQGFKGYFKSSYGLLAQNRTLDYLWDIHDGRACNPKGNASQNEGCTSQKKALNASGATKVGMLSTDVYADAAVKYLQKHVELNKTKPKPLYMYLAFTSVHASIQAKKEDIVNTKCKDYPSNTKYFPSTEAEEANSECPSTYPFINTFEETFPGPPCNNGTTKRKVQCGAVHAVDRAVGRIRDELKRNGMWTNTIILVHGDNGGEIADGSSNYPHYQGKGTGFEGGLRTPAFIGGGKVEADKAGKNANHNKTTNMIIVTDIPATWAALANLPPPQNEIDGVNQYDALIDPNKVPPRTEAVMVYGTSLLGSMQIAIKKMEDGHTYKLARNPSGWSLYGIAVLMQSCAVETDSCLCWLGCMVDFLKDASGDGDADDEQSGKSKMASADSGPNSMLPSDGSVLDKIKALKEGPFCTGIDRIRTTARAAEVDGSAEKMRSAIAASQETLQVLADIVAEKKGDQWFLFDLSMGEGECANTTVCPNDGSKNSHNIYYNATTNKTSIAGRALIAMEALFLAANKSSVPSQYSPYSDPWANFVALGEFVNPFRSSSMVALLYDPASPPAGREYPVGCELRDKVDELLTTIRVVVSLVVLLMLFLIYLGFVCGCSRKKNGGKFFPLTWNCKKWKISKNGYSKN